MRMFHLCILYVNGSVDDAASAAISLNIRFESPMSFEKEVIFFAKYISFVYNNGILLPKWQVAFILINLDSNSTIYIYNLKDILTSFEKPQIFS